MSIEQELKIEELTAELEMAHSASKKYRAKYMGLCRRITEAMVDCEDEQSAKPIVVDVDKLGGRQ